VVSQVQWFKPSWCDQFPIGKYRLRVGDITVFDQKGSSCDQRPCVHLENVPYYLDDDTACDEADFATNSSVEPALLLLEVCSVNDGICVDDSNTAMILTNDVGAGPSSVMKPWLLDICLDYFSVANPFLCELQEKLAKICCEKDCADWLKTIVGIFRLPAWRQFSSVGNDTQSCECEACSDVRSGSTFSRRKLRRQQFLDSLRAHLEINVTPQKSKRRRQEGQVGVSDLQRFYCICHEPLLQHFHQILPWLCPNVREYIFDSNFQLLLPHHISDGRQIDILLNCMIETLLNSQYGTINENGKRIVVPPVAITIARSMDDGFTPKDIVETLLNKVVAAIQDVFGNRTIGEDQRLSLSLFDLTSNPCEQCVSLFLNSKAKNCVAGGV
jgi:hypothetical protein